MRVSCVKSPIFGIHFSLFFSFLLYLFDFYLSEIFISNKSLHNILMIRSALFVVLIEKTFLLLEMECFTAYLIVIILSAVNGR